MFRNHPYLDHRYCIRFALFLMTLVSRVYAQGGTRGQDLGHLIYICNFLRADPSHSKPRRWKSMLILHQGWFTALYTQHLLDSQSFEFEICILYIYIYICNVLRADPSHSKPRRWKSMLILHQGWFTALYTQHLLDSQSFEFEICILHNMPLIRSTNIFFQRRLSPLREDSSRVLAWELHGQGNSGLAVVIILRLPPNVTFKGPIQATANPVALEVKI